MSKLPEALKRLRARDNLTQSDLAEKLGVAKSTISMYEVGKREPDLETLEAIADIFNVPMSTLVDRQSTNLPDNIIPLPRTVKIPLVGSIACGTPVLAVENLEGYIDMPDHVHADFALRCKGDSMIGARIFDGDIVYIKKQDIVDDGQIAAVLIGEEATLKRVRFYPDHIVLEPANPAIEPWVYWREEMNEVHIIGLAVAFTSMVRH